MNKEEILAKAQQENKFGDEREQLIEVEAHKNSALWTDFLCGIMFLLTYFAGDARWEYFYVCFFMKASYYCSRALKLRKKWDIVYAILYGFTTALIILVHVKRALGW